MYIINTKNEKIEIAPHAGGNRAYESNELELLDGMSTSKLKKIKNYTWFAGDCRIAKKVAIEWLHLTTADVRADGHNRYAIINHASSCVVVLRVRKPDYLSCGGI